MKQALFLICAVVFLGGCTAAQTARLNAERPEVLITKGTPDQIRNEIINRMIDHGFQFISVDPYSVVLEKKSENALMGLAYGSSYDPQVYVQARFSIVPQGEGIRVVGNTYAISNKGSVFQRQESLEGESWLQLQRILDEVKRSTDGEDALTDQASAE